MRGDVSALVHRKVQALGAEDWLAALPDLVSELEREWAMTVGEHFEHGSQAYVAQARLDDGTPAVLKILIPRTDIVGDEMAWMRLAPGRTSPRLFQSDPARLAYLMEHLGPSLFELGLPMSRRHEILVDAARAAWRPAPEAGLGSGADEAARMIAFASTKWESLGHPCSERALSHAIGCAQRRMQAHDDDLAVLVHGDVVKWNVLQAHDPRDGFRLVDPIGLHAEPELDLGVIMREDPMELLRADPYERAGWLAARTGLDVTAIWEWGCAGRMVSGLVCIELGLDEISRAMFQVAERAAAS